MLKGLVAWWGRNPVAGNLLMLTCVLAGALSFWRMEKEFFPPAAGDAVVVDAYWPGASPEDMETQVTMRIEEATADLDGLDWVRSRSSEGSAWVRLIADPGVDMDDLTAEVRSRVDAISGFPPGLEPPRISREINRNWGIIIGVHGEVDERLLRDTAEALRDRIALLPGAANTIVVGVRRPEVSIELSEAALQTYGLTFDEVAEAVRGASINISAGSVRTPDGDFQLRARNLADTQFDFENIVVRQTPEGAKIRLRDVATVIDGFEDTNLYSVFNGQPAALISILTADRSDIWATDSALAKTLEEARAELPPGVQITTMYNETEDYNSLLDILFSNALQGFFLIFVLLLLTLHPKVAFWATLGVITAFAGSFIILPYAGVSLNFMAVFGFLLVLGIMVDDAIIVGEAVYERAEAGHSGPDAAIFAVQLVLKPLVASVMVTMIAFSPWILIQGEARQFTSAISIVVMSTLFFSLVESLIILPAHLAHVKKPDPHGQTLMSRLMRLQQRCAHSVVWVARNFHGPLLRSAVRLRYLTWAIFLVVLVLAVGLMASGRIKSTFFPEIEGDFLMISIDMPQTTPFSRMQQVAEQLENARRAIEIETEAVAVPDPNTGRVSRGVIRSWSASIDEHTINAYVGLTPPQTRDLRSSEVTKRLEELMGEVPDAERLSFSLGGGDGGSRLEFALMGENGDEMREAVEDLKARLLRFSDVLSVRDSEEAAIEELRFTLLPGAEQVGVTLADVTRQVRQAYFGEEVQRLPRDGDEVRVYVRYPREDRRTLESLGAFRVRTAEGAEVPLASIATWEFAPGVTGLDRRQRMSSILVEAELRAPEARANISRELESNYFPELEAKYPNVTREAIGEAEAQAEFFAELVSLGAMALFAIYFLLAVTFRSYAQPAMILSVIPFAFVGAAVGHMLLGISFALFSWLGMIAAIGVVVNDNVVLVDRANQIRGYFALRRKHAGAPPLEDDVAVQEVVDNAGQAWELVKIDGDLEVHEEFVREAIAANFQGGPIDLKHSSDMRWEKSEFRERAEQLEAQGFQLARVSAQRGIVEASISRFRQIFLTSITEFVGLAPMLLENAALVQFLKPMALALAFGVLLCMPATLILTPVFYMIGVDIKRAVSGLTRFYGRLYGLRRRDPAAAE